MLTYTKSQDVDTRIKRLERLRAKPPLQSQHPAKLSARKSCESGDLNTLLT